MDLGLNWVDLVILAVLLFFAFEGYSRTLTSEILDFFSFLIAFFVSFNYYNFPANFYQTQFDIPHGLSLVLGFMSVWFLVEATFFAVVRIFWAKIPIIKIWGQNFLAIIPSLLKGVIFISLFLVLAATFPIQPQIKKSVQDSKIGSFLLKRTYGLEQPVKNVFGGVSEDSLTFLTIKPQTSERVNLGFHSLELTADETSEKEMFDLINNERITAGLKDLIFDPNLQGVARLHSQDMLKRGYFSHYSPEGENVADRSIKSGVDFLVIGENLAYAPGLELAHQGLMNSEGHRANILSEDFGKVGIGVIDGGTYGKMFTQVFSN